MTSKTLAEGRIDRITSDIIRVAEGDYSTWIELSGEGDGLDRIAAAVNMVVDHIRENVDALDRQRQELSALNESLQGEIAERKRVGATR